MPELPEVETVARGLRPFSGRQLNSLEIIDARVWFESELDPEALRGKRLLDVSRRGKYILWRFAGGLSLLQHLRMTGKMLEADSSLVPTHVREFVGVRAGKGLQIRCRFHFEGAELWFFDTRRFGTLTLVSNEDAFFLAKGIAPDPISDPVRALPWFLERFAVSGKPVKAALLDQMIVAGVGNIYADEALHAARIHPRLPACKVREPELLWAEILRILHESIRQGGSTIRDYVSAEGKKGTFAGAHLVYGRTGEPCASCGRKITRITLAGRSTHFCASCQGRSLSKSPKVRSGLSKGARKKRKVRRRPSREG